MILALLRHRLTSFQSSLMRLGGLPSFFLVSSTRPFNPPAGICNPLLLATSLCRAPALILLQSSQYHVLPGEGALLSSTHARWKPARLQLSSLHLTIFPSGRRPQGQKPSNSSSVDILGKEIWMMGDGWLLAATPASIYSSAGIV